LLGWTFAEGDDFHSVENVKNMASGTPLTDEDRAPWLASLRDWINAAPGDVVLTCSALRRRYRDVLRQAHARVRFVHLDSGRNIIASRLDARANHFMPPSLLDSQVADLEPLAPDEDGVVLTIEGSPIEITNRALTTLGLVRVD
jgi:gluconokinase